MHDLGVGHEELRSVLARLRICANSYSLDHLTRTLSEQFGEGRLSAQLTMAAERIHTTA